MTRTCTICKKEREETDYYFYPRSKTKRRAECKTCSKKRSADNRIFMGPKYPFRRKTPAKVVADAHRILQACENMG